MAELRARYDNPETVAEAILWLVDTDTIELRELALNLLWDLEAVKGEMAAAEQRGRAQAARHIRAWLRSEPVVMLLVNHQPTQTSGCVCGWNQLGRMHPRHVLEKLAELWTQQEANI